MSGLNGDIRYIVVMFKVTRLATIERLDDDTS